jgi:hypothetical protein
LAITRTSQPFVEANGVPADDNKLDFVFAEGLDEVLEVFIRAEGLIPENPLAQGSFRAL